MSGLPSLSIVIPAYCEAANIIGTLDNVTAALAALPLTYEILVVDDGSTDGTGAIVTAAAQRFSGVRLLVNERNMGFGWTYRRGVEVASCDYIVMVHGDNAWPADTLRGLFSHVGEADIVVGYTKNMWKTRTWSRTAMSKTFTLLVNVITGHRLTYYNGLQIHRASVLKSLTIQSTGYGFQAEVLVKSLRRTRTYVEVPIDLVERREGQSKAFRLKNAIDVLQTLARLHHVDSGLGETMSGQMTGSFARRHLDETCRIAAALDPEAIERFVAILSEVRARGGRLFFLGVGGGAAHASHAVNDFRKLAGFEAYAPTDNVAELTARTNDDGWDTVFAAWLKGSRLRPEDGVFVFSVGGGSIEKHISANLVGALQHAKSTGSTIVGIVGRDDGFTAAVADICIVVPCVNTDAITPHTESFQAVLWHLIVSHPALKTAAPKWESTR